MSKQHINEVKIWFERWSKAGATPNLVVEDRLNYISGLNWVHNWINTYFFNKVSDFLLGNTFLCLVFFLFFYSKDISKFHDIKYLIIYLFLFIFLLEWFFRHPTLRYGGYHIIGLLFFLPLCFFLEKFKTKEQSTYAKPIF